MKSIFFVPSLMFRLKKFFSSFIPSSFYYPLNIEAMYREKGVIAKNDSFKMMNLLSFDEYDPVSLSFKVNQILKENDFIKYSSSTQNIHSSNLKKVKFDPITMLKMMEFQKILSSKLSQLLIIQREEIQNIPVCAASSLIYYNKKVEKIPKDVLDLSLNILHFKKQFLDNEGLAQVLWALPIDSDLISELLPMVKTKNWSPSFKSVDHFHWNVKQYFLAKNNFTIEKKCNEDDHKIIYEGHLI